MLNINDLENRHKKYKLKKYALYAIISILSIFVLLLLYFAIDYIYSKTEHNLTKYNKTALNDKNSSKIDNNVSIKNIDNTTENREINKTKESTKTDNIVFTPSLDFIKNIQQNLSKDNINTQTPNNKQAFSATRKEKVIVLADDSSIKIDSDVKNEKIENSILPQSKQITKVEDKVPEKIKINKDNSDIQDVIKRFNTNKNPALSLFIAKRYYQIGEYETAYNYALTTNGIDSKIDDSWIIFSKSLVKLNQKDKALQTLEQYISFSKSQNAKILLDDIKSGKFK